MATMAPFDNSLDSFEAFAKAATNWAEEPGFAHIPANRINRFYILFESEHARVYCKYLISNKQLTKNKKLD